MSRWNRPWPHSGTQALSITTACSALAPQLYLHTRLASKNAPDYATAQMQVYLKHLLITSPSVHACKQLIYCTLGVLRFCKHISLLSRAILQNNWTEVMELILKPRPGGVCLSLDFGFSTDIVKSLEIRSPQEQEIIFYQLISMRNSLLLIVNSLCNSPFFPLLSVHTLAVCTLSGEGLSGEVSRGMGPDTGSWSSPEEAASETLCRGTAPERSVKVRKKQHHHSFRNGECARAHTDTYMHTLY